jgi:hypothetical protein
VSATTIIFFFAKEDLPGNARNVVCNISLLSFEPEPNPVITVSGPRTRQQADAIWNDG